MKKYCPKPFMSIRPDTDVFGKTQYKPCCHYASNQTHNSVDEYLQSTELADLREHFLTKDELPAGCEFCTVREQAGLESTRQITFKQYPEIRTTTDIIDIELFPSNVCNLRCFMCVPNYSSAIGTEYQKLNWIQNYSPIDHSDRTLEILNRLPNLRSIAFIGGEFFLTKSVLEILDTIIEKQLRTRIITNATMLTSAHFERLKKINDLDVLVSVDGIGPIGEFIRWGSIWSTVESNIDQLKRDLPKAKVHVSTVVQPLNLQHIVKMLDWANRRLMHVHLTNLSYPTWLEWQILTEDEKRLLAEDLKTKISQTHLTKEQLRMLDAYQTILSTVEFNPTARHEFKEKFSALVKNRNIHEDLTKQVLGLLTDLY